MERLQKVLAHAGVASRRKSEELILEGRVSVNGDKVTELGTKVNTSDLIEVDGVPIYKEEPRYILLYKPKNVISAVADDKGREVVTDYIHLIDERIYPVGRLDYDTTGLILLTNDGEFANLLMHPKYQIDKVYVAKVEGIMTSDEIFKLTNGVVIDGKRTSRAKVKVLQENIKQNTSIVELTIHEGWNHQVKKMFKAVGHEVIKLKRERFSFLNLHKMNPGDWRELTAFEVDKLSKLAKGSAN
ncbi:pseudouridine synthase [Fundicoccus sp. Sow4_H7]|uniref:pseudouridine synthase n=1 Tax=Fundicoccus sp. Sow4_H7 TaxID=3438784 RepID=UPI003F8F3D22